MRIRATAVQLRTGLAGQVEIDGRYEIQWQDEEPWLSFIHGIQTYALEEWYLHASLMQLGAAKAGIEFIHVDCTDVNRTEQSA
jgi:hypothetical protein